MTDVAVEPNCTETGLTEGKHCSVCNEVLVAQEVVAAKGHTEVIDPAVPAGCITTGLTEGKHCSVCNKVLIAQEVVAANGHKYTATVVTVGDQCTITHTCEVCKNTVTHKFTVDVNKKDGDFDGKHGTQMSDVLYLMDYLENPEKYGSGLNQLADYNRDNNIDIDDAKYLMMHVAFPEDYPLNITATPEEN